VQNGNPALQNGNPCKINGKDGKLETQPCKMETQPCKMETQPCKMETQPCKMETQPCKMEVLPSIIYRFKFTEEFMEELYNFSKIHQYDHRKDFKEAWELWSSENNELIDDETTRLLRLGYDGDIMDKMYKSARYYFRKKSTQPKQPKQRRKYISISNELLKLMDNHIKLNIENDEYKPKSGFKLFCIKNELLVKETIVSLQEQGMDDLDEIENKIKKTYKNRYFMLTNK
jgi:hypothetical protein